MSANKLSLVKVALRERRLALTRNTATHEAAEEERKFEEAMAWFRAELHRALMRSLVDPLYEGNTRNASPSWEVGGETLVPLNLFRLVAEYDESGSR